MIKNLFATFIFLFLNACQNAHIVMPQAFASSTRAITGLNLVSIENNTHSLEELYKSKGAVLIFWQYSCPCVKRYQQRINDLYSRYGKDLDFYHISSNSNEPFSLVIQEYKRRNIALPLLRDENKSLARALNVKGTPSAALLNNDGELIFLGWIDNERHPGEKKREAYLEDAIVAYLNKKPILRPFSPMFGCAIR